MELGSRLRQGLLSYTLGVLHVNAHLLSGPHKNTGSAVDSAPRVLIAKPRSCPRVETKAPMLALLCLYSPQRMDEKLVQV